MGLGFRRDRRESTQVLQVSFAAVRDNLDVAAPFRLQFSHQTEGGLTVAAESLMSQGIAVTIGAESGNVARLLLV